MALLTAQPLPSIAVEQPKPHKQFLDKTFQLARQAREKGNHPFGALLVYKGQIILTAENLVTLSHDVTAHAEMELLRKASQQLSKEVLRHSTLYTSTEPCAMCSGAIYWSGINRVVYGCSAQKLEQQAHGGFVVASAELLQKGKRVIDVKGPYYETEAVKVHEGFW